METTSNKPYTTCKVYGTRPRNTAIMENKTKKYFITGVAGTGKTTISLALKERGITVFDFASVPGLCYWRDKITKEKSEYSPNRDKNWLDTHERICDPEGLKTLLDNQKSTVVITGVASGNQEELLGLFDKVFLLQCDPETLLKRFRTRETSVFAKGLDEQNATLEWQKKFDPHYLALGAIPIRTEGAINDVIKHLISQF